MVARNYAHLQSIAPIFQAVLELALADGCDSLLEFEDCWEYELRSGIRLTANCSYGGKYNSLGELVQSMNINFYCGNQLQLRVEAFSEKYSDKSCLDAAQLFQQLRAEAARLTARRYIF